MLAGKVAWRSYARKAMAVNDNRMVDGYLSGEGGIDSSVAPSLVGKNQWAWAVNTSFRDVWPTPRPGWIARQLEFGSSEELRGGLEDGYFQGAGSYRSDDGSAFIALSVSGRVFTIDVSSAYEVAEITIPGDPNTTDAPHAWFQQAEGWLVIQNMANPAMLFNGAVSRRSGLNEVPVGGPMAYGKGRLWVARGSQYFGGDAVYSDKTYGRDSVIRFTENTFLNEGGAFSVPDGPVTGMAFAANLDTSLGDGDLLVGSQSNVYANSAPTDRTVWKNMEQPIQRYAARAFGPMNHESMVLVNGDVIFRSPDGIRSLQYSRRDFEMWGQTPISVEAHRALRYDTDAWLSEASAVNFDNRVLMTIQPQLDNDHGVWHRGLVSIDYHRVGGMQQKRSPAWEGVWTGLRILRILTVEVHRVLRCFILALSDGGKIQLWEVTKTASFDRNEEDDVPIEWILESRGMTFERPAVWKRLMGAVQWFDRILGEVSIQAYYRADESECWSIWDRWSECVQYRQCTPTEVCPEYPFGDVLPIHPYRSQFRPYIGLTQPPDVPEGQTGGLTRDGYDFQLRLECSGRFRLKRLLMLAQELDMPLWGDSRKVSCPDPADTGDCQTGTCPGIACCDRDDYSYRVNSEDDPFPTPPEYPDYPHADPTPDDPYDPGSPGYPDYPGSTDYPGYPAGGSGIPIYPEYPIGPDNPTYSPEDPEGWPTQTVACTTGTIVPIDSEYVWSLTAGQNPNELLTQAQIDCHMLLHAIEVAQWKAIYEAAGNTVTIASGAKWVHVGTTGAFYAMILKGTCDPNDGIDDHIINFSGYTTLYTLLCVTPPP